ncbi:MAG: glycosyltransferase family 4 protein, partial [Miltoncostaeaceae bacterium]
MSTPARTGPLRIAIPEFAARGGLLHYSGQLAEALAGRGHDVYLLTPPSTELAGHIERAHLVPCLAGSAAAVPRARGRLARLAQRGARAGDLARAWWDVVRWLRANPVDVLMVGDLRLAIDAAAFAAVSRLPRRPLLVDICHNIQPVDTTGGGAAIDERFVTTRSLAAAYRRADVVVVHGRTNRRAFRDRWATPASTIMIPHGDERLFGPPPDPVPGPPTALFFGNWSSYKDLHLLLDAFAVVRRRLPEARLEIVGHPTKDSDAEGIMRRAAAMGDAVGVRAEYVEIDEARACFARACVVALPYRYGFQSGVTSVAFSLARPVVCTRVGGLHEAVEASGGGRVVPSGDPSAFADALVEALADPVASLARGRRAYEWQMSEASWEAVA